MLPCAYKKGEICDMEDVEKVDRQRMGQIEESG